MSNRSNFSRGHLFFTRSELISWSTAFTVEDLLVIAGNVFALDIFLHKKNTMRSKANYFLVNLAVTDELVGTISIPLYIFQLVSFIKTSWNPWPVSIFVYMTIDLLSGFASMLTVVVIALDRFYAVCFPIRHRVTPARMYYYLIFAVWFFSGVISGVWAFWVRDKSTLSSIFAYIVFALILGFVLTLAIAHTLILIKVRFLPTQKITTRKRSEQEKRLTKILNIVTLAFLFTWLPFHLVNFTFFFSEKYHSIPINVVIFTKFLQYAGSFINPLVYYANNRQFRKSLHILIENGNNTLSFTGVTAFKKKYRMSWKKTSSSSQNEKYVCSMGQFKREEKVNNQINIAL